MILTFLLQAIEVFKLEASQVQGHIGALKTAQLNSTTELTYCLLHLVLPYLEIICSLYCCYL